MRQDKAGIYARDGQGREQVGRHAWIRSDIIVREAGRTTERKTERQAKAKTGGQAERQRGV
jgi:hypothetical protein